MAEEKRTGLDPNATKLDVGVMMAKVVGYLDPTFMCGLEVTLLRQQNNTVGDTHQTLSVKYASPFYGVTGFEYMGQNKGDFNDTQKSYGMWFPTPEIGTTVLVVFVNGDPSEGYFIGCVPSRFANQMIPGIGASKAVEWSEGAKEKYDVEAVPVAEVNRKTNDQEQGLDFNKLKKPVHPLADRLLEEGLLEDDVRGAHDSSGRRNIPNSVFGISTPGPFDRTDGAKKGFIGKKQVRTTAPVPVSRLGGSQIVMDDGHDQFQRKTKPSEGPPEYADLLNNEKGKPDIPKDEYLRFRTRTGHQVLLHNSEDLIYIVNSRGTSWIEMTSDGKIDIYAEDSVSIHTQNDFNFRADRDVNIEAGRNINLRTEKGRLHGDIKTNLEFTVGKDTIITTNGGLDLNTAGSTKISSVGSWDLQCDGTIKLRTDSTFDLKSRSDFRITSDAKLHLKSSANLNLLAGNNLNLKAENQWMQSGSTYWTKPSGGGGSSEVSEFAVAASIAVSAAKTQELSLHSNPVTKSSAAWNGKNRYKAGELQSIMKRVPMHEPWSKHENLNPTSVKPDGTDRGN